MSLVKCSHVYNILFFFKHLPNDILRHIFEFDNTYHYYFQKHEFKRELVHTYWNRTCVMNTVKELIFTTLEQFIVERQYWYPTFGAFYIKNGNMFDKNTRRKIRGIRNEIDIFFSTYETNFLRWKYVYKGTSHFYKSTQLLYDGCIAIHPEPIQNIFYSGRLNALCERVENIPTWCNHIGSMFWI